MVLLEGAMAERDRGRMRELESRSIRLSPAGDRHHIRFLASSRCVLLLLGPGFDADVMALAPTSRRFAQDPVASTIAASLARELARERDPISPIAAQTLALELVARTTIAGSSRDRHAPPWLARVRDALHADPAHPYDASALARDVGIHPVYLARMFRRWMGLGLGDYARRLRADAALRRLVHSRAPLAVVAAESGYADQSHLTRSMRRYTGLTPAELRESGSAWLEVAGVQEQVRRGH